jgi:hypothetical protein
MPGELWALSDSSWADVKPARKSTLCYQFFWRSSLASILALSTAEAELITIMTCATEINFMRKLMTELGFPPNGPTILYEDNTSAIALAETGHFKGLSKHFDLRFKWVVDMLDLGLFKLDHVSSPDQHADTGTADRVAPVIQKYGQYQLYGMGATYC